jgi:hypothetical protein
MLMIGSSSKSDCTGSATEEDYRIKYADIRAKLPVYKQKKKVSLCFFNSAVSM